MATIKTAIALYDGVTGPLKSMNKALGIVINSFESVKRASENAVNTSAIQTAREELAKAETALEGVEQNIRDADNAQKQFKRSVEESGDAADDLLDKLKRIAATVGGIAAVKKLAELSDAMSSTSARLSLIVDDGGSVSELEDKIMASAQRSRASYQSTAAAVSKLGLTAADAFNNNDELIAFSELVNKQFTIAGTTANEASAAMLQLTQAMASGVLRGDELNSIFEQAPTIIQSIADYLDVPIGQIRSMASEGQITADVVKNAMFASADDIEDRFNSMILTWGQVFTMASNIALRAIRPLLSGINWLANNISIIGPAVLGLGMAFLVFQTAAHWTQIATAATAIYHGVVELLAIGFGVLTGNTAAASAAVFKFNSALLASPITWAIMVIAALIGVLYGAVAAVNKFAGTSVSATGIIAGAFAMLGAFVLNSTVIPLYNGFAMIANFIGNVFNDPVAAVEVAFYDMCLTVIGYIKNLAEAIETLLNKIPGVTVDITSGLDNFYAGLEDARQKVKNESGWIEYFETKDYIDYSDAAAAGYSFGEGLADKVSGLFGYGGTDAYGAVGNTLEEIYDNTGDTAANTAAISDALDITEEDLKYLREIAERDVINRFTTAEIKVDMSGMNNNITNSMDIDGVIDRMANGASEALEAIAEGVHAA